MKKKDKRWGSQKRALKSLFRNFGKRNGSQPHQDPPKEEGQLGTFWKVTSKEECNEKIRKIPATNVVDTTLVLVPMTKTLEMYYKRRIKLLVKGIQQLSIRAKRALERVIKLQKNKEKILGFKEIQTSQVLEA